MQEFNVPSPISVLQSHDIIRLLHIFTCKPNFPVYKEHKGLTYPWPDVVSLSSGLFHQRTSQKSTRFFSKQIFCTCQWILMKISIMNMGTKHVYSIYVKCFFSVVPLVMLCIKHIYVYTGLSKKTDGI